MLSQDVSINGVDIADKSIIDCCLTFAFYRRSFVSTYEPGIDTADTNGRNLQVAARCEYPRIDLAAQDHRCNVHGIAVGDAAAVDESCAQPQRGRELSGLGSTAMNQYDPDADLVQLDAVTMDIDRRFDCIYSNKVLQHLTRDELRTSLANQAAVLNAGGILFHSFWLGDGEEVFDGLFNAYYTEETLRTLIGDEYEIDDFQTYDEMGEGDSFFVVMRKTKNRENQSLMPRPSD